MLKKIIATSTGVGILGALAIMYLTTPATIHPVGLLVFFVCVYAATLGLITVLVYTSQRLYYQVRAKHATKVSLVTVYEYATVVALGPVILLALQTVGRLQMTDVLFTAIFVALGCFYIAKRRG